MSTTPFVGLAAGLQRVPAFAGLTEEQLAWFVDQSTVRELQPGEVLFRRGEPADVMIVVLEGQLEARLASAADGRVFTARAGEVTGMLPFSRMTEWGATSRAVAPTRVLCFPAGLFPEMLHRIPVLEARLVQMMADRVREATRMDQQREKLMALGKLSAGLAHELNNPAAATRRAADELRRCLTELRRLSVTLAERCVTADQLQALGDLHGQHTDRGDPGALTPIARAEREDEIADWLGDHGVQGSWGLAESFLAAGVETDELESIASTFPRAALPDALAWLGTSLAAEGLVGEVERAAGRISELVASIKSYSHMDAAPDKAGTDVHAGLRSTLTMLGHKLRDKGITLERDFAPDLPAIAASPGELNQVWTNLIDNAADAVGPGGTVRVRTAHDDTHVLVEIADNGPGIPAEVQSRIWEPFFTTKDVGEGTGLGLDIARRIVVKQHGGEIGLESRVGDTRFLVRLPIYAADGLPD